MCRTRRRRSWLGTTTPRGSAEDVAVDGGLVYVADGTGGLVILRTGYEISGKVTDTQGNPISGVTISATGGRTAVTGPAGTYALVDVAAGSNTLSASKAGYHFAPARLEVTVPPNTTGQDFLGTPLTYSISGRVADAKNNPIAGVTISATGGRTTLTNTGRGVHLQRPVGQQLHARPLEGELQLCADEPERCRTARRGAPGLCGRAASPGVPAVGAKESLTCPVARSI